MSLSADWFGLLPLLVLTAIWVWRIQRGGAVVDAMLESAMLFAAGCWIMANALGAFGALQPGVLRWAWSGMAVLAYMAYWRRRRIRPAWPRPRGWVEGAMASAIIGLLIVSLVRAIAAPPNTVDVLNYHLPRQLMWLQQGSLDPYLTINARENIMPPLAEVIGLQFLGLTGDDHWANLVQWAAYAGLALALARLCRLLGASRGAAMLAALLGLLVPMAWHEATNAKNDLLAAFWLCCGAVRLAHWRQFGTVPTRLDGVWLGLAISLAWLTKSTAMIFAPPLILCGLWSWWRRTGWREVIRVLGPGVLLAIILIAPFHGRNLAWYGKALGEHRWEDGGDQIMDEINPALWVSNVSRHAALHLLVPWSPINTCMLSAVRTLHKVIGLDVNDRRSTLWTLTFDPEYAPDAEIKAGAPAHFLLGLPVLALVALGIGFRERRQQARWLAVAVLGGAGLFCGLLKWQPWSARLIQPLFALGTVAAVVAVDGCSKRFRSGAAIGSVTAVVGLWWPGADTVGRTLWTKPTLWAMPRDLNYYLKMPPFALREKPMMEVIKRSGARCVFIHNLHDVPYPLMRRMHLELPDVHFAGAPAHGPDAKAADAVLVLNLGAPASLYLAYNGSKDWRLVGAGAGDGLYLPSHVVAQRGMWNVLPDFAGWARHDGLPAAVWYSSDRGARVVREMSGNNARVAYEALGHPLKLHAELMIPAGTPASRLELLSHGMPFAEIRIPSSGVISFEVDVPSEVGPQILELRSDQTKPPFAFTKLQFRDQPID